MLPKRNSNTIKTESAVFRYVVSEASQTGDHVALTVNIQSESNGAVLRVNGLVVSRLPVMESKFYVGRTVKQSLLPRHVLALIDRGIDHGWLPDTPGPAVLLNVTTADVFGSPPCL